MISDPLMYIIQTIITFITVKELLCRYALNLVQINHLRWLLKMRFG